MNNLVTLPLERYRAEREQIDPAVFERRRLFGVVDTMERAKVGYWWILGWLNRKRVPPCNQFRSLDEAIRHFSGIDSDPARLALGVARHFAEKRADYWRSVL